MIESLIPAAKDTVSQKVIGYSKSKTYTRGKKNPKTISETVSIGIQAWEIGALLAAIALYEYVNGPGSFTQNLNPTLNPFLNPSTLPGGSQSNPGENLFYSGAYGAASELQNGINYLGGIKL